MITTEEARTIIAAAEARAIEIGVPVTIAILDAGANLKALSRMDGAVLGALDIAIGKARTAVLFEIGSAAVQDYLPAAPGLQLSNGGLMTFAGGLPLTDTEGRLIGAVGISGGAVPQDLDIAEAAAVALI